MSAFVRVWPRLSGWIRFLNKCTIEHVVITCRASEGRSPVEESPDSLLGRLRRVVVTIVAVLGLVIAVVVALSQLGEALRRLVDAWRPFCRP